MTFTGDGGEEAFSSLINRWEELVEEVPELQHSITKKGVPEIYLKKHLDVSDPKTETEQLDWIISKASAVVDLLTPIFLALEAAE